MRTVRPGPPAAGPAGSSATRRMAARSQPSGSSSTSTEPAPTTVSRTPAGAAASRAARSRWAAATEPAWSSTAPSPAGRMMTSCLGTTHSVPPASTLRARSRRRSTPVTETQDPRKLIVIGFDEPLKANEFLLAAVRLQSRDLLKLHDAVFVARDAEGRSVVRETQDISTGRGALGAGMWGLL